MVRAQWLNLNGKWDFEIDNAVSGEQKEFYKRDKLKGEIIVPFCPESKLSGVNNIGFMNSVWYRKSFNIPEEWNSKEILLHFGAVDYLAKVWINGRFVGEHSGGYTSFSFNITKFLTEGENSIVLSAFDDVRSGKQPSGKQRRQYMTKKGCRYTRTTGIWQTVWLEAVNTRYISSLKMTPDIKNTKLLVEAKLEGDADDCEVLATAFYKGKEVGKCKSRATWHSSSFEVGISDLYLWEPGKPELYDLEITLLKDDVVLDHVKSYFGMRSVFVTPDRIIRINGKNIFQRLVLDQGFYPDGIYTAPTDEDLKKDIKISMELGFNGARLHEKIFEPRFLYWADKLGYIVWEEYANWGLDVSSPSSITYFLPEWMEAVRRDYNHPSIVGWCPFNETQADTCLDVLSIVYKSTKIYDASRPVIDTSGYVRSAKSDIYDSHNYTQDPEKLEEWYATLKQGKPPLKEYGRTVPDARMTFVSEYGGIKWAPKKDLGWGYGKAPKTEKEFVDRYRGLTTALLKNPRITAFCYTQLYDIEQEVNGLYTYDREPKFDCTVIAEINRQIAAIEE
jgi:beta-galactosidase/beta-glucuronidase